MRNPSTWVNYAPGSEPALFIGRGFIGHEHLPWFNLTNMNGRAYDPLIGQFPSPDNQIQNPGFTQNYNRYGYCFNNPLKFTDPSGLGIEDLMNQSYYPVIQSEGYRSSESFHGNGANFYRNSDGTTTITYEGGAIYSNGNDNVSTGDPYVLDWQKIMVDGVSYYCPGETFISGSSAKSGGGWSVDFQGDSKLTVGVQAGGNIGGLGGTYGINCNLCSVTLIGNEGKKLIYPTSQQGGLTQVNQGISGGFIVGAGVSHTFDGNFGEGGGYASNAYSYQGALSKNGIFGITYNSTPQGNTLNIGFSIRISLILGFEADYNLRIKW